MGNDVKTFRLAAAIRKNTRRSREGGGEGKYYSHKHFPIFFFSNVTGKKKKEKNAVQKNSKNKIIHHL